jgi:hypothetical protein
MEPHKHSLFWKASLTVGLLVLAGHVGAQRPAGDLKIEDIVSFR